MISKVNFFFFFLKKKQRRRNIRYRPIIKHFQDTKRLQYTLRKLTTLKIYIMQKATIITQEKYQKYKSKHFAKLFLAVMYKLKRILFLNAS